MTSLQPELMSRLRDVAHAIDDVLVAEHGPRAALKDHPPWDASLPHALTRYGPGPLFDLWVLLKRIEALRVAWTGQTGALPPTPAEPIPEPDEAPGLAPAAPAPADEGTENQLGLAGN